MHGALGKAAQPRSKEVDHKDITKALIEALEIAEKRPPLESAALASRAYRKLQYDFPLLEESELNALAGQLRDSFQSTKSSALYSESYVITTKLVENITAGVLGAATRAPAASQAPAQSAFQNQSAAAAPVPSPEVQELRGAYQRLCVVVLLQFVSAVLSVSEADAWRLLASYDPQDLEDEEQEEDNDSDVDLPAPDSRTDAASCNGQVPAAHSFQHAYDMQPPDAEQVAAVVAASRAQYTEIEAAEEDGDDFSFEALEHVTSATTTSQPAAKQLSQAAARSVQQPGSQTLLSAADGLGQGLEQQTEERWAALRARILHLASPEHLLALDPRISFTAAAGSSPQPPDAGSAPAAPGQEQGQEQGQGEVRGAWLEPGTLAALLGVISAAGMHARVTELQPLVSSCVGLVGERVASQPQTAEAVLGALWDALGVKGLAGMPRGASARRSKQPVVLPLEVSTAFNLVCSLTMQAGSSAEVRGVLWRHTRDHLLPLLERCLADMAVGGPGSAHPQTLAGVALACQVVVLFLEHSPGNVDPAKTLLSAGVVRSLALLLPTYGSHPGAEPLRLAALLCAARNQEVYTWIMAVPGVTAALQALSQHSCAAPHAVLWPLVAPATVQALKPWCSATGSKVQDVMEQGVAAGGEGLPHMHAVLQLMARVSAVAGGGLRWGSAAESALRQAASSLKDRGSASSGGGAAGASMPAVTGPGQEVQCVIREVGPGGESEDDEVAAKAKGHDAAALDSRRAQQLRPACLKLIKQLLTTGGKTD